MNPLFGGSTKKPVVKKSTTKKPVVKKSSTKKPVVKKSTTKKTASKRKASGIDTDELIAGKKRKTLHRKRAGSDELIAGKKRKRAGSDELIAGEVSKEEMTSGKNPSGYVLICIDYFTRYVRGAFMKHKSKLEFDNKKPKFKIGDKVVIANEKNSFLKSYRHNAKWGTSIFTVIKINFNDIITYKLNNNKNYYAQQLQLSNNSNS